ncbi:galactosylceramide sulfotransferase-like [Saccoglossus kowalevskii]|uniref:Galactosylceramide sulfotransferase-like n=1 Tax=Saccoglossus kowalevskii TaxID=10224 RepID=A0ABM0M8A7_SACKO|nr:PREDICTED: galactosylceramide sulfotransferase-like [Saccoglossus kowalevskii]
MTVNYHSNNSLKGTSELLSAGGHSSSSTIRSPETMPSHKRQKSECVHPLSQVVFVKTYKTASTTISSILFRYGISNNLSFVLPSKHNPGWFSRTVRFNSKMKKSLLPPLPGSNYSILASHVPFNKKSIDDVIPHAKYITILRHPVSAYESIFGFFKIAEYVNIDHNATQDAFKIFLSNSDKYLKRVKDPYHKTLLRNRQIFDIGLDFEDYDNATRVGYVIKQASKELDLVMITEYFDESLILLKKLLCWKYEDIFYIHQNKRNDRLRVEIEDWERQRILELNAADFKLYQHFNYTFWRKVKAYGPNFSKDLATFRRMLDNMHTECAGTGQWHHIFLAEEAKGDGEWLQRGIKALDALCYIVFDKHKKKSGRCCNTSYSRQEGIKRLYW